MTELRRSARVAQAPKRKAEADPSAKQSTADSARPTKKGKVGAEAGEDALLLEKSPPKKSPLEKSPLEKSPPKKSPLQLEVGDAVPDITLTDENGKPVSLPAAAAGHKYLVIFAYPKASTPGCTRQAKGFQKNLAALLALDAAVYGLLADLPKSQLNFVTKQGLEYSLLSDPDRKLIGALGARKLPSGVKRSHWVFADGKLAVKRVQIGPEASIEGALADVELLASK